MLEVVAGAAVDDEMGKQSDDYVGDVDSHLGDDEEMAEVQDDEDADAGLKAAGHSSRAVDIKRPFCLKQLLWKVRAAAVTRCSSVCSSFQPGSPCLYSSTLQRHARSSIAAAIPENPEASLHPC